VSVDAETKKALRKLADADYAGNLSALITHFAEDARRRMAAGEVSVAPARRGFERFMLKM